MNQTTKKSEYDIQAEKFLSDAGISFKAIFKFHGPHWEGEKDFRDVYEIVMERKDKTPFTLSFGQSINDSSKYYQDTFKQSPNKTLTHESKIPNNQTVCLGGRWKPNKPVKPSPYSVLSAITKYDPDSFENFCGEYGYDTDSRKAERVYLAVQKEWNDVRRFFSEAEIEALQEIN